MQTLSPKEESARQSLLAKLDQEKLGRSIYFSIMHDREFVYLKLDDQLAVLNSLESELTAHFNSQPVMTFLHDIAGFKRFFKDDWQLPDKLLAARRQEVEAEIVDGLGRDVVSVSAVINLLDGTDFKISNILPRVKDALKKHLIKMMRFAIIDREMDIESIKHALRGFEMINLKVKIGKSDGMMAHLLAAIDSSLKQRGLDFDTRSKLGMLNTLAAENMREEIKSLIKKNKGPVIKNFLQKIKNNRADPYNMAIDIAELRKMGFYWDELNVIEKQVAPKVTENSTDFDHMSVEDQAVDAFKLDAWNGLVFMLNHDVMADATPAVARAVDSVKRFVVQHIIQQIKTGDYSGASEMISELRTLGIDWPEFDLLDKKLKADG